MRASRIAAAVLALGTGGAWAADVEVHSNTLIGGRPDVVDGQVKTVVPLYEQVGLRARNLPMPGFADVGVSVDAWGGLILPGSPSGLAASDVNLAFIEGKLFKKRLKLRLGRQFVVGGTARANSFDGLLADYTSQSGLGLSTFVGVPVERRFSNTLRGDFVFGTRAYWGPSIQTQVGLSYVHMLKRGALSRQEVGLDARWQPLRSLGFSGALIWCVADTRFSEIDVGPRWTPTQNLEVLLNYRRTAPELFLPLNSIFTVFADTNRDDLGLSVGWQFTRALSILGDARLLWINGEQGYDVGARLGFKPQRATSVTAQYHRLQVPANGYHQGRIGARHLLPSGLGLAVDLETYVLDKAIRDQTVSFSASTTATYAIGRSWLAGVTLFAATTPTFESRYEVIGKLSYVFASEGR